MCLPHYTPNATGSSTHSCKYIFTNTCEHMPQSFIILVEWEYWKRMGRIEGGGLQVGEFKKDKILFLLHKTVFV